MTIESPGVHEFGSIVGRFVNNKASKLKQLTLPIEKIVLPKYQPRKHFDPKKLEDLQNSIKQHGILEPLIVRPLDNEKYELVAGERRLRAATNLGVQEVPVTIHNLTDQQALHVALIENLQREDLNPIEETRGILNLLAIELSLPEQEVKTLLYQMKNQTTDASQNVLTSMENVEKVFSSIGKMTWHSFMNTRLVLLNLPNELVEAIERGEVAYTKAQAIAQVKDEAERQGLLDKAIAQDLSLSQIREKVNDWKKTETKPQKQGRGETHLQRAKALYEQIKKRKIWQDKEKKAEFDELLTKLEILLAED